ncbi:MAG: ABC transporter ATP-binding protein [Phycisphaerales bacterium]
MTTTATHPAPARPDASSSSPVLEIRDLVVSFDNGNGPRLRAVDGASMTLFPRQTLAVVGESGCGKSVTAMSVLRLIPTPPASYDRGRILFNDTRSTTDLLHADDRRMRRVRGGEIAMIFQEPMTSLNPVFSVGEQVTEAIRLHQDVNARGARDAAVRAMEDVGIPDPARRLNAYPHEFSGGMRQRVMIAMALACEPRVLLADEPTTALDVTIQKQILELLADLKRTRGMSMVLITHDLGVVAEQADVVCVMYAGRVVEYATAEDLMANPRHPYTRGLLACVPKLHERVARLSTIREVVGDESQYEGFSHAGEPVRPWWPWHERPQGAIAPKGGEDSTLIEVAPRHWVGVWRTGRLGDEESVVPSIPPAPLVPPSDPA